MSLFLLTQSTFPGITTDHLPKMLLGTSGGLVEVLVTLQDSLRCRLTLLCGRLTTCY